MTEPRTAAGRRVENDIRTFYGDDAREMVLAIEAEARAEAGTLDTRDHETADAPAVEAAWEALTIELDEPQPGMTSWGSVQRHRPAIEAAIRAECQDLTEQWANRAEDAEAKLARAEAGTLDAFWIAFDVLVESDPQKGYSRERQRGWDEAVASVRALRARLAGAKR